MYQELQKGWVEVICGPMFAGKSEELIRRVKTLSYADQKIICFKPDMDNRYDPSNIASHDGDRFRAIPVKSVEDIRDNIEVGTNVVAIDEVQFFDQSIVNLCENLASAGVRVIVAGLDCDFRGEPFPVVANLLARAEVITKLSAACTVCGCAATRTQRLVDGKPADYNDPIIMVGASESYEARCRKHHQISRKKKKGA